MNIPLTFQKKSRRRAEKAVATAGEFWYCSAEPPEHRNEHQIPDENFDQKVAGQ